MSTTPRPPIDDKHFVPSSADNAPFVLPEVMQAVVYENYGDASVLHVAARKPAAADAKHVIIRVHAASVNPIDYRLRGGEARFLVPGGFPRVPGYDVAGDVVYAPCDCGLAAGDRVMAFLDAPHGGAYAQYARCRPTSATTIPASMPFEDAAAIPLAGSTALQSLRDHGRLKRGDRVLVSGASGGVGAFAVQIAKAYGAEVTGVASGKNESFVRSLGADRFIDYNQTDFSETDDTWDLVFDVAGKSSYWKSRRVLARNGRYVSTEPNVSGAFVSLWTRFYSQRGTIMLARPCQKDLRDLVRLYEAGEMKVIIDKVFPLAKAGEAHRRIEQGVDRGKIVIRVPLA